MSEFKVERCLVQIAYWDKGQEYGLQQLVEGPDATMDELRSSFEFLLKALIRDYNVRHPRENT